MAGPRSGLNGAAGPRPDREFGAAGAASPGSRSDRDYAAGQAASDDPRAAGYQPPVPASRYRAQVDAAVERGRARTAERTVGERTQDLLARQLALISELEATETDPERLDALFRLDHLTVQLRRQDASLRALRGEEPVRWWNQPAPLSDVAIAAASEVEQYRRIEVLCLPTVEVAPWAVVDVVHLLAELLDNATMFSPAGSPVHVVGGTLRDGRILVDIHDGGPGMEPEVLDQLNARLNGQAGLDAGETTTSGLMVVERLARRLRARVALFPWGDAGMTSRVILPGKLVRPVVAANPRLKTLPRGR
jgi:signal transduction histidine kinase